MQARGKSDKLNSLAAGCTSGALLTARAGPQAMAVGCAGFMAFSAVIDLFMHPKDVRESYSTPVRKSSRALSMICQFLEVTRCSSCISKSIYISHFFWMWLLGLAFMVYRRRIRSCHGRWTMSIGLGTVECSRECVTLRCILLEEHQEREE